MYNFPFLKKKVNKCRWISISVRKVEHTIYAIEAGAGAGEKGLEEEKKWNCYIPDGEQNTKK